MSIADAAIPERAADRLVMDYPVPILTMPTTKRTVKGPKKPRQERP